MADTKTLLPGSNDDEMLDFRLVSSQNAKLFKLFGFHQYTFSSWIISSIRILV